LTETAAAPLGFELDNDVDVARTLVEVVTENRPEHFQAAYTITVRQLGNLLSMGVYEGPAYYS
jgi:hypothetical protein